MKTKLLLLLLIFTFASLIASAQSNKSCRAATFPSLKFSEANVFPKDRKLKHPEDGRALSDG